MISRRSYFVLSSPNRRPDQQSVAFGYAHYSYNEVVLSLTEFFERQGIEFQQVRFPEGKNSDVALGELRKRFADPDLPLVHICNSPFENLRTIYGAYNIAWVFWEYDSLVKTRGIDDLFFIRRFDEVWVSSESSADFLRAQGLKNVLVFRVPARKKRLEAPRRAFLPNRMEALMLSAANGQNTVTLGAVLSDGIPYLCAVLNPWDYRKNLINLINAFLRSSASRSHRLVIKLTVDNNLTRLQNILDILAALGKNLRTDLYAHNRDRVVFVSEYMSEEVLLDFYQSSAGLVSLPHCEGQNLPVVDALLLGKPVVVAHNTAMLDFVPKDYPGAVTCRRVAVPSFVAKEVYGFSGRPHWFDFDEADAIRALEYIISPRGALDFSASKHCGEAFSDDVLIRSVFESVRE